MTKSQISRAILAFLVFLFVKLISIVSAYAHGDPTDHDKHILIGHKKYCQWDPSAVPVPITSTPCVEITDLDPSFAPLDTVFFHIEMKNIDPFPVDLTIIGRVLS